MIQFIIGLVIGGAFIYLMVNREALKDDNNWTFLDNMPVDRLIKLKKDQKVQFMNNVTHEILTIEGDC